MRTLSLPTSLLLPRTLLPLLLLIASGLLPPAARTAHAQACPVQWPPHPTPIPLDSTLLPQYLDLAVGDSAVFVIGRTIPELRAGRPSGLVAVRPNGAVTFFAETISPFASPVGAVDAAGRLHVAWKQPPAGTAGEDDLDATDLYYRRHTAGRWSDPQRIYTNPDGIVWGPPALFVDRDTLHLIVTATHPTRSNDIVYLRSEDGGDTWTPHSTGLRGDYATLAPLPGGRLLIAFTNVARTYLDVPRIATVERSSVLATTSHDGGRTWSGPALLHRSGEEGAHAPVLAYTTGVVYAVWRRYRGGDRSDTAVWHARSADGGATWTDGRPLETGLSGHLTAFRLAVTGEGCLRFVFVRQSDPVSPDGRLYETCWTGGGWTPPEPLYPASYAYPPALAVGPDGALHAAWTATPPTAAPSPETAAWPRLVYAVGRPP